MSDLSEETHHLDYKQKYLKYKAKYLQLKALLGGGKCGDKGRVTCALTPGCTWNDKGWCYNKCSVYRVHECKKKGCRLECEDKKCKRMECR
jgi:hypothetical protein